MVLKVSALRQKIWHIKGSKCFVCRNNFQICSGFAVGFSMTIRVSCAILIGNECLRILVAKIVQTGECRQMDRVENK